MITLSPTTAFMVYLATTLFFLFGTWFLGHLSSKKKTLTQSEQDLFVCEYCQFAYLTDSAKDVTKCPQCDSFNKHNKYKAKSS